VKCSVVDGVDVVDSPLNNTVLNLRNRKSVMDLNANSSKGVKVQRLSGSLEHYAIVEVFPKRRYDDVVALSTARDRGSQFAGPIRRLRKHVSRGHERNRDGAGVEKPHNNVPQKTRAKGRPACRAGPRTKRLR
jgi:hypothetical protein